MRIFFLAILIGAFSISIYAAEADMTLIPAFKDGKAGYIRASDSTFAIAPQYADVGLFVEGVAIVKLAAPQGGMALIDTTGTIIIDGFDGILPAKINYYSGLTTNPKDIYAGLYVMQQGKKRGVYHVEEGWLLKPQLVDYFKFLNEKSFIYDGNLVLNSVNIPIASRYEVIQVEDEYIWIQERKESVSAKTGIMLVGGKMFLPAKYTVIERAESGHWIASCMPGTLKGIVKNGNNVSVDVFDPAGKKVKSFKSQTKPYIKGDKYSYEADDYRYTVDFMTGEQHFTQAEGGGEYKIFTNGSYEYGLKDKNGKVLLKAGYYEMKYLGRDLFAAATGFGSTWGLMDQHGTEIMPFIHWSIDITPPGYIIASIREGDNLYYGLYDRQGNELYPLELSDSFYFNRTGRAVVEKDGLEGVIDQKGELIQPFAYESIHGGLEKQSEKFVYRVKQNDLWGMLDEDFSELLPCVYRFISEHSSGNDWYELSRSGATNGLYNSASGMLIEPGNGQLTPVESSMGRSVIQRLTEGRKTTYTILTIDGQKIGPYDSVQGPVLDGVYLVERDKLYAVADLEGKLITDFLYTAIGTVSGVYLSAMDKQGEIVYMNSKGVEFRAKN